MKKIYPVIEYYKPKDFNQLVTLLKKTGLYYKLLDTKKVYDKKIRKDYKSILIAKNNKKIIGCIFMINDGWNPQIFHFAVDPAYQNLGIGGILLKKAEKLLKKDGAKEITLFVEEDNKKVLKFYKKRGYSILYKTFCLVKRK